ncbi:MAG: hypothetical protein V3T17_04765 [Pseudomonadales bacterium]
MKNILRTLALSLCFVLHSVNSYAAGYAWGTLYDVHFTGSGAVIAYINGPRQNVPTCAVSFPNRFAIDGTSAAGKVQVSGLLSAYLTQKVVVITGTGDCVATGTEETINYFYID